jgi:hypothetical protein
MSLRVYYEVLNQKGSPALFTDTLANRPAFGFQGRLFISTDTAQIYEDTGSAWTLIADATGSVIGFVPYSGAINDLNLGSFDLTADIGILNQVKAVGSGGLSINANSGTQIAVLGAGGGANMTLLGGLSGTSASFSSSVTALTLVKSGGTSSEYLKADGSVSTLTNPVTGTGLGSQVALFNGTSSITGSVNLVFDSVNGRLGIGSSGTPIYQLDVTGNGRLTSSITALSFIKDTGTSAQILAADGSVITAGTNITISGGTISSSGGGGMAIGGSITSATAGSILYAGASGVLAQDNANFFFDAANDRLGIGTNSPSVDIQVIKSATAKIGINVNGTGNIATFFAQNNTDGHYLEINSYGTTTSTTIYGVSSNGCTAFNMLPKTTGFGIIGNQTNAPLIFGTNNANRMQIFAGGNVIIGGTTDAGFKLDVQGTFKTTGASTFGSSITATGIITSNNPAGLVVQPTTTTDQGYFTITNASGSSFFGIDNSAGTVLGNGAYSRFWYNSGAYPLDFYTSATIRTRLTATGNLLIATTTDNAQGKLQINGGLTASAISVSGATYTVSATLSQQYYHVFNGSTGQTLTIPTPLNNNYQYVVINNTANTVTLAAATSTNIITTTGSSVANITLIANQRVLVIADGNNKYYQIF